MPKCIIADVGDLVEKKCKPNYIFIRLVVDTVWHAFQLIMFFAIMVTFVCKNEGSLPHMAYALALLYEYRAQILLDQQNGLSNWEWNPVCSRLSAMLRCNHTSNATYKYVYQTSDCTSTLDMSNATSPSRALDTIQTKSLQICLQVLKPRASQFKARASQGIAIRKTSIRIWLAQLRRHISHVPSVSDPTVDTASKCDTVIIYIYMSWFYVKNML